MKGTINIFENFLKANRGFIQWIDILVADIGATNSRFQLATVRLEHPVSIDLIDDALVLPTNTFATSTI